MEHILEFRIKEDAKTTLIQKDLKKGAWIALFIIFVILFMGYISERDLIWNLIPVFYFIIIWLVIIYFQKKRMKNTYDSLLLTLNGTVLQRTIKGNPPISLDLTKDVEKIEKYQNDNILVKGKEGKVSLLLTSSFENFELLEAELSKHVAISFVESKYQLYKPWHLVIRYVFLISFLVLIFFENVNYIIPAFIISMSIGIYYFYLLFKYKNIYPKSTFYIYFFILFIAIVNFILKVNLIE